MAQDARAVAWIGRQARRARWIVQDLLASARALLRVGSHTRCVDHPVGIGLLEGEPRAVVARPNAYRIRLVNDGPVAVAATLGLRGESPGRSFVTRGDYVLAEHTTRELVVVADWEERFEIADALSTADAMEALLVPDGGRRCRVVASLSSTGAVEELTIIQSLVTCASST